MRSLLDRFLCLLISAAVIGCALRSAQNAETSDGAPVLQARLMAVGVADIAAFRERGTFPPAGPRRNDTVLAGTVPDGSLEASHTAATDQVARPARNGLQPLLPRPAGDDVVARVLLSRSGSGASRLVFAEVLADGSIVQAQAQAGTVGLAPSGTIAPLTAPDNPGTGAAVTHTGAIVNWVPDPILYIADPHRNGVVALALTEDGRVFRIEKARRLDAAAFSLPVDLAPAVVERVNPRFSSRTTLAGGADFYVANRGNGTVVRMSQGGTVLAIRRIGLAQLGVLGPGRLNGIATAPDATRIWVSISGEVPGSNGVDGAILELPAFGPDPVAGRSPGTTADVALQMGLGPAFNGRSCADCHRSPLPGGMGADGLATVLRIGKLDSRGYDPMLGRGGPIARMHSVSELGISCAVALGVPPGANLISVRNAPALYGLGLVDEIPDATILAGAVARSNGIHGHPNIVAGADGRKAVGRFGWKADTPRLELFVADALRNELGITSPLAAQDLTPGGARHPDCSAATATPKDDGSLVESLTAFVRSLEPLPPHRRDPVGSALFVSTGCADCHTPTLAAGNKVLPLYSDLLLHDMGAGLNDGVIQDQAQGNDWRTTPLWGLSVRARFLHDGRARTIEAAILAHGGEADPVVQAYRQLDGEQRSALLTFLSSL
jgi:hypothetical protein